MAQLIYIFQKRKRTNEMGITLTVQELLTWLLLAVSIAAVIVLIVVLSKLSGTMSNLNKTLDEANKLLKDVDEVVGDAKEISGEAKKTVKKATNSVSSISKIINDNIGPISTLTGIAAAGAGLTSLLGHKRKKK